MNTPAKRDIDDAQIQQILRTHGIDEARVIRSSQASEPLLADYTDLTDVQLRSKREPAEGLFIAESSKIVTRALAAGYSARSFLLRPNWLADLAPQLASSDAPIILGTPAELENIVGFHLHRGALAAMERKPQPTLETILDRARTVVVLEDIVDHTNVGAIFRSAAALGADAVLISPRCADPLYRRSIRVSMGTVFSVPWARIEPWPGGIDLLREHGFTTAALALRDDAMSVREFARAGHRKTALVMGTEGAGLSRRTIESADARVIIPMSHGIDSLNVAAAAAVAVFALQEDADG